MSLQIHVAVYSKLDDGLSIGIDGDTILVGVEGLSMPYSTFVALLLSQINSGAHGGNDITNDHDPAAQRLSLEHLWLDHGIPTEFETSAQDAMVSATLAVSAWLKKLKAMPSPQKAFANAITKLEEQYISLYREQQALLEIR